MTSQIKTLLLHANYTTRLSYYDDWMDAFKGAQQFDVSTLDIRQRDADQCLKEKMQEVELIVLLHSTNGDTTIYLEPLAAILSSRKCPLLTFVGNEVNLPGSPIAAKRHVFGIIQPEFVATQLLLEAGQHLWGDLVRKKVISVPHALNPTVFTVAEHRRQRPIDIGVRAVRYLPHIGDQERNKIHDLFAHGDLPPHIKVDISTSRLDRPGWAEFLRNCNATVSSQAGSWYLERNDETVEAIRAWTKKHHIGKGIIIANDSALRRLGYQLPWWMRNFIRSVLSRGVIRHESKVTEGLPFDEVYERFFRDRPLPGYYGKCISSRHFDAVGTETCQILVEGRYNDILQAGEHYIPLKVDFSNLTDVIEQFEDIPYREGMVRRTREYILAKHTYENRISDLYDALQAQC